MTAERVLVGAPKALPGTAVYRSSIQSVPDAPVRTLTCELHDVEQGRKLAQGSANRSCGSQGNQIESGYASRTAHLLRVTASRTILIYASSPPAASICFRNSSRPALHGSARQRSTRSTSTPNSCIRLRNTVLIAPLLSRHSSSLHKSKRGFPPAPRSLSLPESGRSPPCQTPAVTSRSRVNGRSRIVYPDARSLNRYTPACVADIWPRYVPTSSW